MHPSSTYEWAAIVQAAASVMLVVATVILVIVTHCYVRHTGRMAKNMDAQYRTLEQEHKAAIRPFVIFRTDPLSARVDHGGTKKNLDASFVNVGRACALNLRARADDLSHGADDERFPSLGRKESHPPDSARFQDHARPPTSIWIDYQDIEGNIYHSVMQNETWTSKEGAIITPS